MKTSTSIRLALLALSAFALTACGGGGGGGSASTSSAPTTVPSIESQFGAGFNADFYASTTATPAVPMAGDIIALSLTASPIQLH